MTLAEYRDALNRMDDESFRQFRGEFGGDFTARAQYVDDFVHHPDHERRLCQILDLPTQEERQVSAALISAQAAVESAKSARLSMMWSAMAVVVSVVALAIAAYS